jgi:translation initiation factor 1
VIRYQRKGRGGKEVTLVELRGVPAGELDGWLSSLKRELGCGGFLEDGQLALSGDQRDRLRAVLEHCGVTRISVG